jgi:hypothetical protein
MSVDPRSYTRALWEQWLGEYGYEFIDERWESPRYPGALGAEQPVFIKAFVATGVGGDSKLEDAIINAAESTGMSGSEARAWYEEARRPALENAERQLAERRSGREPTPRTRRRDQLPTGRPPDSPKPAH